MKRVRMIVAYDGTAYHGWQFQLNGLSIEEVLNEALSALLKEEIKVIGASRTDAGVHALGNVAVFDTKNRMPADKICFAPVYLFLLFSDRCGEDAPGGGLSGGGT